ncbi:ATP12 family protein [Mesorhizobium sp. SB112]|uniref:ATP12 family chaperone protein n=1 Tax=Mesorhizobium sp. SB112 TaxID=3151853 RepID=UPI00326604C6
MRDLLEDIEAGRFLSDPDPVRRAQIQMKTPLPKRFYETVSVAPLEDSFAIHLDGKSVRTPTKALLALRTEAAADLVAEEFRAQVEVIDPVSMPVMRLVNTAIDGVVNDPQAVLEDILRFASSDMLFYRADTPERLVALQDEAWDPILEWARVSLGARFTLAEGVVHVQQPREAIGAVGIHLQKRDDPLKLAALHLMTSLTGSALIAIAVEAGEIDLETAWTAAHIDENWNIEHWGQDSEALARQQARKRDMLAAVKLLEALESPIKAA